LEFRESLKKEKKEAEVMHGDNEWGIEIVEE
jgi:hypothetical protein